MTASYKALNLGCGTQQYGDVKVDRYHGSANLIADVEMPLPFTDRVFDIVYSRFLFEHLRNPGLVLKEMVRVLKPGGKLVLITDNASFPPFYLPPSLGSGFHVGGYSGAGTEDRHYSVFTREHLKHHLQHEGLKITKAKYVYADEVGGKCGLWQKISKHLGLHQISFLEPFCTANILVIGIKKAANYEQVNEI